MIAFSRRKQRGLTLIELIVAFTIMMLLTTMALPLARFKVRRQREKELRWALAEMRKAIDKYKDASSANLLPPGKIDSDGYPESLKQLVDGVRPNGSPDKKVRFLRRIPRDPFTNSFDWGLRSTRDDPDSTGWGGQNTSRPTARCRALHPLRQPRTRQQEPHLHSGVNAFVCSRVKPEAH